MWLENAKQIPISYINVQLLPRGEKKKKHICKRSQKGRAKWCSTARDQVVKSVREHGFASATIFLPGGCKMCTALKENTHCFMPLCGFQVQTLLQKCEHRVCCLNVFKTWLVKA